MKIDGHIPADQRIAQEQGVNFEYELDYGTVTIQSRMASKENAAWRIAMAQYETWSSRRKQLKTSKGDEEADRRFIGILHDTLVINWSTTITSEGQPIAPTRENFIDLFNEGPMETVVTVYLQEAADERNFRAVSTEEAVGNSAKPSGGASAGQKAKTGSDE